MVVGRRRCIGPVVAPPQAAAELLLAARARIVWICERRGRRPAEGGVGGDRRRKVWAATGREMEREREKERERERRD